MALPVGLPLLAPAVTAAYAARLGVSPALRTNQGEMDRLPQDFADMIAWQEQVRAVPRFTTRSHRLNNAKE